MRACVREPGTQEDGTDGAEEDGTQENKAEEDGTQENKAKKDGAEEGGPIWICRFVTV